MQLDKVSDKEQADKINQALLKESNTQHTHPFFIVQDAYKHHDIFILNKNEEMAGVLYLMDHGEGSAEIYKLYIFERLRGKGYAVETVETVKETLKGYGYSELCIEALTFDVIPFWTKLGFMPLSDDAEFNRHFSLSI